MTARHPLAPYGIEDRQPLWDTEEPDGTCQRCGEDVTTCRQIGCDTADVHVLHDGEHQARWSA